MMTMSAELWRPSILFSIRCLKIQTTRRDSEKNFFKWDYDIWKNDQKYM